MKKILLLALISLSFLSVAEARGMHGVGVSFGVFYSSLTPYGEWIPVGGDLYGWRPVHVTPDWRPYFMGRWLWTDDGWYWATDEPWGWATYHYGRWYYDDYYGWIWIPGYDWAPAWVEWRYGGDYLGWAPLGPYAVFSISFGIHYSRHWVTPYNYWTFVDCRYITNPYVHRYVYRRENNTRFIGRTRGAGSVGVDGGRIVTRGPDRTYIERRGRVRIDRAEIVDGAERGRERIVQSNGRQRIEAYRPHIDDQARGGVERPARVRDSGRPLRLDEQSIDVRARDRERAEGRDMNRMDQYRSQQRQDSERRRDDEPAVRSNPRPWSGRQPESSDQTRRLDRQVERSPILPPRDIERRSYEPRPYRSERQYEPMPERRQQPADRSPRMMQREQPRYSSPGGSSRSPEIRQDRGRPSASSPRPAPQSRGGGRERGRGR